MNIPFTASISSKNGVVYNHPQHPLFDEVEARKGRDEGIKNAIENADKQILFWSDFATDAFKKFIATHSEFMAEDVRDFAHNSLGLPHPPDDRAWGAILLRAARNGLIEKVGYRPMKSKNCHANPKSVWRVINGGNILS